MRFAQALSDRATLIRRWRATLIRRWRATLIRRWRATFSRQREKGQSLDALSPHWQAIVESETLSRWRERAAAKPRGEGRGASAA